ncbi:MAG: hypothetical protein H6742_18795 [Alphaproteobacteria bacterium]|nr:hypothetical protein [Alphaproteobacteria bacterium]
MTTPPTKRSPASLPERWWGDVTLVPGEEEGLLLGPVGLRIRRRRYEWTVGVRRDPDADPLRVARGPGVVEGDVELARFGMEEPGDTLRLLPVLAPRPVACRPEIPFVLVPRQAVRAYVSTPLWLRVSMPDGTVLVDIDIHRPSGSWFGPDTLEGELCYASRTMLRLHPEDVQHVPHRAMTEVHLRNPAETPLRVSQVAVPVPRLSLGTDSAGHLWTQSLTMGVEPGGLAAVSIGELPAGTEVLQRPVHSPLERRFTRTLTHLLR